ncbi:MAG: hypothetical protein WA117_22515 [Verrucomicrobiia bacterium]
MMTKQFSQPLRRLLAAKPAAFESFVQQSGFDPVMRTDLSNASGNWAVAGMEAGFLVSEVT